MSLELPQKTQWLVVTYVQLVVFIILLIAFAILTKIQISKSKDVRSILRFFIFFFVFLIFKIAGAILGLVLVYESTFTLGVFITTYIFDSISLGFITRSIASLIQHMITQKQKDDEEHFVINRPTAGKIVDVESQSIPSTIAANNNNQQKTPLSLAFRVVTLVLLAAIILSIAGTSQLSDGESSGTPITLVKASSLLFLVGVLAMIGILIHVIRLGNQFNMVAKILIASLVILIVRCIYSILSAFHGIDFGDPSKYMIFFGNYEYYTFLGLLMEALSAIFIIIAFWFW
ncbi:hypothetical protein SBY92_001902 [Candida maltosa Xu316]|uniref:DUF7702 domain-containing protein n=1 Tax=Candida maltosa (strain Xu316) TaxID=1245528 RepID=M3K7E2_CANMX|nr:hypothetical protein G210_0970 [Candida maltosa Xu316]